MHHTVDPIIIIKKMQDFVTVGAYKMAAPFHVSLKSRFERDQPGVWLHSFPSIIFRGSIKDSFLS